MRSKPLVSGFLTFALIVGAPGLPCWQASAQMIVKAKVAGVPYKAGTVTGTRLPSSLKLDAFKSFSFTPNLHPNITVAPNVVLQNGVALPQTVLPVSAITDAAAMQTTEQVSATFFQTLQTLGAGLAQDAAKNGGAASGETLTIHFDGSLGKKAPGPVVETKTSGWGRAASGLKKRTALAAASTLLAVPGFAQTAQASSEQPSWGPVAVIGLTVVGLSLFVYNMTQAAKGWKQMRALERSFEDDYSLLMAALGARSRLQAKLSDVPGATVAAQSTNGAAYELVVMFMDKTKFEQTWVPAEFEGLKVRKEDLSLSPAESKTDKKPDDRRMNGWLAPLLTGGFLLASSGAAKAATEASSGPFGLTGAGVFFGAAALIGASVFVANMAVWVKRLIKDRRTNEKFRPKLGPAISAAFRLRDMLQAAGVPVPFVAAVPKGDGYELVAQFANKADFEAAVVPSSYEGLNVRKELQSPGLVAELLKRQPKTGFKLNGWLAPLLTAGFLLASSTAAKAKTAASMSSSSDVSFWGALGIWTWGYLVFDKDFWWCWAAGIIVFMGFLPWWIALPLLLILAPQRK